MEIDWQRRVPPIVFSLEELNLRISPSGFHAVEAELIEEGLANTNYRIVTPKGRYLQVRFAQRNPKSLAVEEALSDRLWEHLPIPHVLYYEPLDALTISQWMPGESMQVLLTQQREDEVLQAAESIGRALGDIASMKFGMSGFLDESLLICEPWPSVYDGYFWHLEYLAAQMETVLADEVIAAWRAHEVDLRQATAVPCLSHADYKPSNLLICDGKLSGILDWEFAHAGTWLLDAGQCLRYLGPLRESFADLFVIGLTAKMDVPVDWIQLATVLDLVNLVEFYINATSLQQKEQVTELLVDSLVRINS